MYARQSAPVSAVLGLIFGSLGGYNDYRFHGSIVWAGVWFAVWLAIGFAATQALANGLRQEAQPEPRTVRQSAIMAALPLFFLAVIWFAFERYIEQNGGPVGQTVPHTVRKER